MRLGLNAINLLLSQGMANNPDKYKATWVSHSSISDFLSCPRAYYLRNVYKDPLTGNKITITSAPLSLGSAVHEVLEALSFLPTDSRFKVDLLEKFNEIWQKYSGEVGGFKSLEEEMKYKQRGIDMIKRVNKNPGLLRNKAIKIKSEINLPNYWLSPEEEIILCGKIDWLCYNEDDNSVSIIDFKTGKNEESEGSLQLPIYLLLTQNTQKRKVKDLFYWYLNKDDEPRKQSFPDLEESYEKVFEIAKRIKLARKLNHFKCPHNGCSKCTPLERILRGDGKKVAVSETRQDIYILP